MRINALKYLLLFGWIVNFINELYNHEFIIKFNFVYNIYILSKLILIATIVIFA